MISRYGALPPTPTALQNAPKKTETTPLFPSVLRNAEGLLWDGKSWSNPHTAIPVFYTTEKEAMKAVNALRNKGKIGKDAVIESVHTELQLTILE